MTRVQKADALMAEINALAGGPKEGWVGGKAQLGYLHLRGEENTGVALYRIYCHISEGGGCVTLSGSLRIGDMIRKLEQIKVDPAEIERLKYKPRTK